MRGEEGFMKTVLYVGLLVIGVDDDPHICENTKPPLSSIRPDYDQAGYDAASMRDEIIDGAKP